MATETPRQSSCESVFTSSPFKFIVGADEKVITLPSLLVSLCSKPLQRLVDGKMLEANTREARLKGTDADTFTRFAEYLFTGTYHDPQLPPLEAESTKPDVADGRGSASSDSRNVKKAKSGSICEPNEAKAKTTKVTYNKNKGYNQHMFRYLAYQLRNKPPPALLLSRSIVPDYFGILDSHALVYFFADQYNIEGLRQLAWSKTQQALATPAITRGADLEAIVRLIELVYTNTAEPSDKEEPLRFLFSAYAADFLKGLNARSDFRALLDKHPVIATDIISRVAEQKS